MMTEILCEDVSRGLRDAERLVIVRDAVNGGRSYLRVETEYLTLLDGKYYLPQALAAGGDTVAALFETAPAPDKTTRPAELRLLAADGATRVRVPLSGVALAPGIPVLAASVSRIRSRLISSRRNRRPRSISSLASAPIIS